MASDAVNPQPSLDEQMGAFRGFSAVDGVVQGQEPKQGGVKAVDGDADEPASKPLTAAEKLAQLSSPKRSAPARQEAEDADDDEEEDAGSVDAKGDGEDEDEADGDREQRRDTRQQQDRKNDPQKRIAQAVGRQRQAERERDAATRQLTALEQRLQRLESGLTQQPTRANNVASSGSDDGPPQAADYQYGELDTKYISDLARYETLQTIRAEDTRRSNAAAQSRENENRAAMAQRYRDFETEGLARYDDFDVVVTQSANAGEWALSPLLASLIIDSDHGSDIAYHLASDRKEAKRVFDMTPAKQAAWFGRREAVLSAETPAAGNPALRVSRAPEAVRRQARGSGSRQPPAPDTTDFAAFERMAQAKR